MRTTPLFTPYPIVHAIGTERPDTDTLAHAVRRVARRRAGNAYKYNLHYPLFRTGGI